MYLPALLALLPVLLPVLLGASPATSLPNSHTSSHSFHADPSVIIDSVIVDASAAGANLSHPHPPCCKACPTGPCTACRTPGTGVCCPCLPPTPPLPPCTVSPVLRHLSLRDASSASRRCGRLAPASCWWSRSGACTLPLPVFRPSPSTLPPGDVDIIPHYNSVSGILGRNSPTMCCVSPRRRTTATRISRRRGAMGSDSAC